MTIQCNSYKFTKTHLFTCLPKLIRNSLHWYSLRVLGQSLLYMKKNKTKQNKTTTTTKKNSNKTSKLNFFWENLGIDQVSNVINKETKVRNTGLLFGFYHHNYLQDIIQTFSRAKFFFK